MGRFTSKLATALALSFLFTGFHVTPATAAASDATLNTNFNANGSGFNHEASDFAIQTDGKIVIVGRFTTYNGVAAPYIIRLNADGTVDGSFSPGTSTDNLIKGVSLQGDGKILITGTFSSYQSHTSQAVARLNSDGSRDITFTSPFLPFNAVTNTNPYGQQIVALSDGSILVVGDFKSVGETDVGGVAKLSSTGVFDTSFNTNLGTGSNKVVTGVTPASNGDIYISGGFSTVNGVSRLGVARLNPSGTLSTFNPTLSGTSQIVRDVALQSDGKVILSGLFTKYILRVNADGTPDPSFDIGTGFTGGARASALAIDSDNKVIVAGNFTSYKGIPTPGLARLDSSGALDATFKPGTGFTDAFISRMRVLTSGDVFIAGVFTSYNGTSVGRFLQITSAQPAPSSPPAPGSPPAPASPELARTGSESTQLSLSLAIGGLLTALGLAMLLMRRRSSTS